MTERMSDADSARTVTRGTPSNGDVASPVSLDLLLPGTVEAPSVARHAVRHWMGGLDCPGEFVEDAVLLVSEVVTNALRHTEGSIELSMSRLPGRLRVEVADDVSASPRRRDGGPLDESGRGVPLLAGFSDRWGTAPRGGGKIVWFELDAR